MTTMLIGPIKGLGISVMWFWILLEGTLLIRDDISAVSLQHVNFFISLSACFQHALGSFHVFISMPSLCHTHCFQLRV